MCAGEAVHRPRDFVAGAAEPWVAEKALHRHAEKHLKEYRRRYAVEIDPACREQLKIRVLTRGGPLVEGSPVRRPGCAALLQLTTNGREGRAEEHRRCEPRRTVRGRA